MKKLYSILSIMSVMMVASLLRAAESAPEKKATATAVPVAKSAVRVDMSYRQEGTAAIRRGVEYLLSRQLPDGSWGTTSRGRAVGNPAITALSGMAIFGSGKAVDEKIRNKAVGEAREFVRKNARADGSITAGNKTGDYPTYTTAIALTFLATVRNPADESIMRAARKFLLGMQLDEDNPSRPTQKSDPKYGGFGYSADKEGTDHADLSNSAWVAEALHASEYLVKEPYTKDEKEAKEADLAWDKLAVFLTNMQNLPETNKAVWVVSSKEADEYGGFVYQVESDPADNQEKTDEKTGQKQTLRTYGSMTYSGLKSMIYANLKRDDPRVTAAVEWSSKHYTLNENPGVGTAGLYYYIQTFSKTHQALEQEDVKTPDGKTHHWREDVVDKLLSAQQGNGEWFNSNGRWMESSSDLVTTYCLLALELALAPFL